MAATFLRPSAFVRLKDKKIMAVFKKQQKENAAKAKVIAQIKAAEEKLAKLQSKLAV